MSFTVDPRTNVGSKVTRTVEIGRDFENALKVLNDISQNLTAGQLQTYVGFKDGDGNPASLAAFQTTIENALSDFQESAALQALLEQVIW